MNLTALLHTHHERSGEQLHHSNLMLVNSFVYIVEHYFLQLASSFLLTLNTESRQSQNKFDDFLTQLLQVWSSLPIQIVNVAGRSDLHIPGRRNMNLIFVDSYESFRSIDVVSYTAHYNDNEYYLIFLRVEDQLLSTEMERIFEYCWNNQLINCNIQIQNWKGDILVYTYYPFSSGKCAQVSVKLINQFDGIAWLHPELYPRKLLNFYGCPLRLATWNVPPFIYLEYFQNGTGRIHGGIEAHLLNALKAKLNFTVEIKVPPNDEQRGLMKGNNVTGALLMLRERSVDFSLGSNRLAAKRMGVVTAALSYYQDGQAISLPLDAYKLSSLEIILYPFSNSIWLLIFITWSLGLIAVMVIKRIRPYLPLLAGFPISSHPYLNVLAVALGLSINLKSKRYFSRLFLINFMLSTLILRAAYQALLFHMIRTHVIKYVPETIEELIEKNFTIVTNVASYATLDDVDFLKVLKFHVIHSVDDTMPYKYIEENPRKKLAAAGPLDFLLYYSSINHKFGVFGYLTQLIVSMPITMYFTKHSYLVNQFDEEIFWLRAMGFIKAWTDRELDYEYFDRKHRLKDNPFGISELYMLFVLWLVGCSLAFLCFLIEIGFRKQKVVCKNIWRSLKNVKIHF